MNKPLQDFKNKGVSVAVWTNKQGGFSFSIGKRYKDKQTGEWKESRYYYKDEVEGLIELLKEAVTYAHNRAEHESQGSKSTTQATTKYEISDEDWGDIPF